MAKFLSTAPLNIRLPGGFEIAGAIGATHRIPDALVEEFTRDQVPLIPGFTWITQDETTSLVTLPVAQADVSNLVSDLSGKAATVHTHAESSVTGLTADISAHASSIAANATSITALYGRTLWVDLAADNTTDNSAALQAVADAAGFGDVIRVRAVGSGKVGLGSQVRFQKQGTRLSGVQAGVATSGGLIFKCLSNLGSNALLLWRPANTTDIMEGSGADNFNVDMDGKTGHGIEVDRAYNSTIWSNIRVFNVHNDYNAWRFTFVPGAAVADRVSQGVIAMNLWGQHLSDSSTLPAFYMERLQESVFIGCKGWGGSGPNEAGDWCYEVRDCRGVQFYGCSAAASGVGGWNIVAARLSPINITIDSPTFELVGLSPTRASFVRTGAPIGTGTYSSATTYAVDDIVLDVAGGDSYVCIQAGSNHTPASSPTFWTQTQVQRTTIRSPRVQTPTFAEYDLDQSVNAIVETGGQIVVLTNNSDNNHVITSRSDLVTLGSGAGNSLFGTTFFQSGQPYAPFFKVSNPSFSTLASAIYVGATLIGTGTGSPLNVITAPPGSLFLRTDGGAGTTLYVKESATNSTGWGAK